ncbi:hypothetical protein L0668_19465 [Paraglaciecola aquimarina]|uniref:Uncharacterized protein n=1 Tax=Paraglaciecola algarum TaxID=3050085 RepID=A0ABS9DBF7_9ALTE|nr:hypothetical protein [Paraglaciecola sp. G1-23]MCF2950296.1 hypothetical protein [Paraglaciecola sp. G1-23]
MNINHNINSAIVSGTLGIQRAEDNISQHSANLASLSIRTPVSDDPQEVLANASLNQLNVIKQTLPQSVPNITSDLVGLSVNSTNAQASAKVVDVAGDTIGTILDILA